MKIIIMGCDQVGEQVSLFMDREGHAVTVIDADARALEHIDASFKGRKVRGVGFDRNVLVQAGIETADAFVATSSSDNANIVAARIARNIFHVPARDRPPLRSTPGGDLPAVRISDDFDDRLGGGTHQRAFDAHQPGPGDHVWPG